MLKCLCSDIYNLYRANKSTYRISIFKLNVFPTNSVLIRNYFQKYSNISYHYYHVLEIIMYYSYITDKLE